MPGGGRIIRYLLPLSSLIILVMHGALWGARCFQLTDSKVKNGEISSLQSKYFCGKDPNMVFAKFRCVEGVVLIT